MTTIPFRTPAVQELIETVIDANSTWAQTFSEMGLLAAFDWDLCLEDSVYASYIAEELGIDEYDAAREIDNFVCQRLWSPEEVTRYMNDVISIGLEYGDCAELAQGIKDYAEREDSAEMIVAFYEAAATHEYSEELLEAFAEAI